MNQIEQSLRDMYELGVEHGRTLAERDMEIKKLEAEIAKPLETEVGVSDGTDISHNVEAARNALTKEESHKYEVGGVLECHESKHTFCSHVMFDTRTHAQAEAIKEAIEALLEYVFGGVLDVTDMEQALSDRKALWRVVETKAEQSRNAINTRKVVSDE